MAAHSESEHSRGINIRDLVSEGLICRQDAIEMGFEQVFQEKDELIKYVIGLKTLAIYLASKTNMDPDKLSKDYFLKAEENFSENIRREFSFT